MNKIFLSSLLILLFSCLTRVPVNAQATKTGSAFTQFELLPIAGKGYVSVSIDNPDNPTVVRLNFIGASEQVEFTRNVPLFRRGLSAMVESAFIWDGELTLVTSMFYPGPQRDLLFVRRYSLPEFEEVASAKVAEAYVPGRLRVPFGYALSPDSTHIMFYSWTYAVPKDPVKMEIHVMDRRLERSWNKRFLLPHKNETFYIYSCRVDNQGNAYLLCEDYQGPVGPNIRIRDHKIERFVLRLAPDSDEATSFAIKLSEDLVVTDLKFTMDDEGNLFGGGFYRQKNRTSLDGVFTYRIDGQTQGFRKNMIPIDKDAYRKMHAYTDEEGKHISGTRQFRDYYLDHLVWNADRGLTLIGEQRIYESEDEYNDILVVQLDTSLRQQWATRVPKKQTGIFGSTEFISYAFLQRGDDQYLLFNDNSANLPNPDPPRNIKTMNFVSSAPRPVLHLVKLDPGGRLLHRNLSEVVRHTVRRMALIPYLSRSDGKDAFLLYLRYISDPDGPGEVFAVSWVSR